MAVEINGIGQSGLGQLLLEAANPNIYRINAFRVLELPVECSDRDIRKRTQLVEVSQKIGQPAQPGPGRALPLEPPADEYTFGAAVQRLRDPEPRFIDEFFWFWPHELGNSGKDEALQALHENDLEGAVEVWANYVNNYSADNVSMHNLAVLAHASALDLEARAASRPLDSSDLKKLDIYWRQTFKRWCTLKNHDGFWNRLEARVREFGDPRLNGDTVHLMRDMLPLGLLTINAKLAIAASERNDDPGIARQLSVMSASGFNETQINEAFQHCIEPVRKQVSTSCKSAQSQADKDPVHADQAAEALLEQCRPLLQTIDRLLPANSSARQAVHDEVALCGLGLIVPYGNKTENWSEALRLLRLYEPLAMGQVAKNRIEDNLRALKGNLDSGNDWCAEGYYDLPESILSQLELARDLMKTDRYDEAVDKLERLLRQVDDSHKHFVRKPLATCLNLRSNSRFAQAADQLNKPRWMIEQIRSNVAAGHTDVLMTAIAVQQGSEQYAAQSGSLVCMCCRRKVNRWVTFTFQEVKMLACPDCSSRDDQELARRKETFASALQTGYSELNRARELDPSNQSIQNNLEALQQIAKDLDISLRSTPSARDKPVTAAASSPKPAAAVDRNPPSRTASTPAKTREPRTINTGQANFWGILVVALLFGLGFGYFSTSETSSFLGTSSLAWILRGAIFSYFPIAAAYLITYRPSAVFWTILLANLMFNFLYAGISNIGLFTGIFWNCRCQAGCFSNSLNKSRLPFYQCSCAPGVSF